MCSAVSALPAARFEGVVTVTEDGLCGMITLRGDLKDAAVAKAVKSAVGLAVPGQRQIKSGAKGAVAWMSPDELLLMVDYPTADAVVAKMSKALEGTHSLVLNVSDARAAFTVSGKGCREVIAKGAPADLSVQGLTPGEMRRTRLGQVAAAFWLADETTIRLICYRSVAAYAFEFLSNASADDNLPGVF